MAVRCPMPQFVARCLEEIGLEGRCGMPLRALFDAMDPDNDVAYRHYAWSVLRGMDSQLSFHIMRPLERNTVNAVDVPDRKVTPSTGEDGATLRRKRKWETTLLVSPSVDSPLVKAPTDDEVERTPKRQKSKSQPLQPVLPSMRRIAAQKQRRRLSESDCEGRDRSESARRVRRRQGSTDGNRDGDVDGGENDTAMDDGVMKADSKKQSNGCTQAQEGEKDAEVSIKMEEGDSADETQWVLRSPRGYRLGEAVEIGGLNYEDAVASDQDGVLGVVACEGLRLKYLGVQDASSMDTISPQFDLLEIIGRSRIRGENAAALTNSRLFGDSRKLHYLLDMLIACKYVVKNIVTADQRRFNIVHLRRFASKFHPSMISPSATIARQSFPKEALAQVIVGMMKARGERTCVFADIGRELGYGKRHQEQLRNYFIQQMNAKPSFPLKLFMARCKTAGEYIGRKLWCIRLRNGLSCASSAPHRRRGLSENFEELGPDAIAAGRPVVERGVVEQMYVAIQDREDAGATVPELRDILGVPTFKLPYKLAQGLISNYNISVEQVVMGKSTMYRMFVPGAGKKDDSSQDAATGNGTNSTDCNVGVRVTRTTDKYSTPKGAESHSGNSGQLQPGTMMEATRGMVRASTIDRRRNYILKRVQMEKVVSLHQLRTGLIEMERVCEATTMDIRSVHRIVDELVDEKKMTTMDISLPPKQVLQKAHRKVKCAVLPGYQRSREAIREFIKAYEEEQQRKYQANFAAHDNDDYVVVTNRRQQRRSSGYVVKEAPTQKPRDQEVVNYSAVSYKLARIGLAKLQKQSRRLGMFFGMMYKCRAFHGMIWDRIANLRAQNAVGKPRDTETRLASDGLKEITFTLKDVLDLLSVKEYIQLVGVPGLLYEQEEAAVRLAVSKGGSWDVLPESLVEKVRGCEADRFSKIVRVLLDLRLLQIVHDTSSAGLFNVFQTSDDFDSIVSRVAFATLSGGLFKIKCHVYISVKQGSSVLHRLPSEYSYAYASGFSCKSKSDHFSGRVPLEFDFKEVDDIKAYWKSLRFLSLEGAQLGTKSTEANSVSINLDGTVIRSAPLSDHNIYVLKAWVPHSTTKTRNSTARAKAAAGPIQALKRKRYNSDVEESSQKRRRLVKTSKGSISALMTPVDTSEAGVSKFRKQVGAKKTCRNLRWTLEDDLRLIDLYLEQMSCRWFIEVPLALQRKEERVAFRTTNLSRTLISWKELSKVFKKKPVECLLRVNDLLETPAIQARLERAKATITQMKNPSGEFHEEIAIMHQPRLVALLCRALQVILHERSGYYSVLADMLMNNWKEAEVKLVWRYLWLAGIITRTPQANEGKDQKQRGFQVHSKVFEMKSLKIPHYLMETFCEAAKYLSFVNENIDEATMMDEENDCCFEHELEVNMPSGQVSVALSSMVSGFSHLVPSFAAPGKHSGDTRDIQRALAVKGLAGHLSRQWGGAFPEDFLKEYWGVKSVFGVSDVRTQAQKIKTVEAFSSSGPVHQDPTRDTRSKKRRRSQQHSLSSWLFVALSEATDSGLTINELVEKYTATGLAANAELRAVSTTQIQREVDEMIYDGSVLEVNGYDHCRFVLREYANLWTLHPYRISSDSTAEKVHFRFDKDSTVVARPWLNLDGSVNTKMAFSLKRKVVNIVMCCPGIQDSVVHKKMRKIISLQDMRSLLEELMAGGIIYARVFRDSQPSITSIFGQPNSPPRRETDIFALSPGELRYVDFSREHLHYFPSVNCMERFGAEVCDEDLG